MATLTGLSIDKDVRATGDFEVVPAGKYEVVILSDELKDTKSKQGKLLEMVLQIIKGEHAGIEIKDRLNILNPSETSQRIGQGVLKKICEVHNVPFPPDDTRKLWGKPMTVRVIIEEFESNTGSGTLQSNKVKAYSKVSSYVGPVAKSVHAKDMEAAAPAPVGRW